MKYISISYILRKNTRRATHLACCCNVLWAVPRARNLTGSILCKLRVVCFCLFAEVLGHDGNNLLVIVGVSLAKLIRRVIPHDQQLIHDPPAPIYHVSNFWHGKRLCLSQLLWCEDERG